VADQRPDGVIKFLDEAPTRRHPMKVRAIAVLVLLGVLAVGGPWLALDPVETPTAHSFKFGRQLIISNIEEGPGSYGDVVASVTGPSGQPCRGVVMCQVLCLDTKTIYTPDEIFELMTLHVTPSQAKYLEELQGRARLYWIPRAQGDPRGCVPPWAQNLIPRRVREWLDWEPLVVPVEELFKGMKGVKLETLLD
jgi:hypothetical protein